MLDRTRIWSILRCPETGERLNPAGSYAVSSVSGKMWPMIDGSPNFLSEPITMRSDHISHDLPAKAVDLINSVDGLVLNLSAGGTVEKNANIIEMEWGLFKNTDVSGDAHSLPFADASFSGVVCCNAFEHYREPLKVVSEIKRVLKAGGFVYILTAFNQPFHMQPHHYFNATPSGVREWFKGFDIKECGSTEFHNGILAAMWLSASVLWPLELNGRRDDIRSITLGELADSWTNTWSNNVTEAHRDAGSVPMELRDITGQAVELVAYS